MVKFELEDVPDGLLPGQYATRVDSVSFVGDEIRIVLKFKGPVDPDNPCLFTLTKHEDETLS